jgi:hypothetical protein
MKQILLMLCASLFVYVGWAEAQTPPYIGATCTFSWNANTESDLAGYRAWAVRGSTALPIVTLSKTSTSHPTSTTCAALGVTADGSYRFNVVAFDLAGNASSPAFIDAVRDTVAPASPANPSLSSPQPVALFIVPNPDAKQTTVSWIPGRCQQEYIVSRLVSGKWIEIGRTHDTWLDVPLVNQVNQPYGVSAVCEG